MTWTEQGKNSKTKTAVRPLKHCELLSLWSYIDKCSASGHLSAKKWMKQGILFIFQRICSKSCWLQWNQLTHLLQKGSCKDPQVSTAAWAAKGTKCPEVSIPCYKKKRFSQQVRAQNHGHKKPHFLPNCALGKFLAKVMFNIVGAIQTAWQRKTQPIKQQQNQVKQLGQPRNKLSACFLMYQRMWVKNKHMGWHMAENCVTIIVNRFWCTCCVVQRVPTCN